MFGKLPATFEEVHRVFSDGSAGFDIKDLGTLNTSHDADLLFLGELHIIQEIIEAVSAIGSISLGYSRTFAFRIIGLKLSISVQLI